MDKDLYAVETKFKVEFYDTDPMQIVWHGNYVKYLEMGRCNLLESLGYGYKEMVQTGYAFPVTSLNVKYIRSLHFGDEAVIKSVLLEYENRIKIRYEIYNPKGELTTKAETTQMALRLDSWESEFVCPKVFTDKVNKVLESLKN